MAFGRLLRDGALRDAFAADPRAVAQTIQLRAADVPAWLQLVPGDVELQSEVLLRKRLDLVKYFAPATCRRLGDQLWPAFKAYARTCWPPVRSAKMMDAHAFCLHLRSHPSAPVEASEWNRLEFALSQRQADWHWTSLPVANRKTRRGLQCFWRGPGTRWREFFFYLAA